jgi:hypothetical protein
MPLNANSQISEQPESTHARVANILPANTPMPLACDACDHEQDYKMSFLRTLPLIECSQCSDKRQFSRFELTTLETTLNNMGYYLSKSV